MSARSLDVLQTLTRLALLGMIGGVATACGSETTRFASNPFSSPFESSARVSGEPRLTGSIPDAAAPAAIQRQPSSSVVSQPLAAPASAPARSYGAPVSSSSSASVANVKGPAHQVAGFAGPAGWTTRGGTSVTVGSADSLNNIATRYGVPATAILSANGLSSAAQVAPGRQIVIPVYNAAGGSAPVMVAASSHPAPVAQNRSSDSARLRFVQGPKPAPQNGDKIGTAKDRIRQAAARQPEPKMEAKAALQPAKVAKVEPQKSVQVAKLEPQKPVQVAKLEPMKPVKEAAKAEPAKAQKPEKVAALAAPVNVKTIEAVKPAPQPEVAKSAPAKEVDTTASIAPAAPAATQQAGLGYRWPAKGRVISGFGGSGSNEGINIAVPEGTPVKAAEDGTVAYAGSDVKGYGKLVLIRHDNGYVSAYAHNGEISVKHGEKVKRGQAIAKSGQSGNVTSPQLHFEIRKGAAPIDPMPHLQG